MKEKRLSYDHGALVTSGVKALRALARVMEDLPLNKECGVCGYIARTHGEAFRHAKEFGHGFRADRPVVTYIGEMVREE